MIRGECCYNRGGSGLENISWKKEVCQPLLNPEMRQFLDEFIDTEDHGCVLGVYSI